MGVEAIAVAALAVSTASTVYSIAEQRKAGKAQQEGQDIATAQQKSIDLANRRQQLREERIRRAQIEQAASNQGAGGSSSPIRKYAPFRQPTQLV